MESAEKILDRIIRWICVILLTVMTILVIFQIAMGCSSNNPNAYTESLSKYMFIWVVIYGSAYVLGLREHMNIGFVHDHTPSKTGVIVEMLDELMVVLPAADVIIFEGYEQVTSQIIQVDAALQTPMGIICSTVSVSTCFILFYFIYNEVKLAKRSREI